MKAATGLLVPPTSNIPTKDTPTITIGSTVDPSDDLNYDEFELAIVPES